MHRTPSISPPPLKRARIPVPSAASAFQHQSRIKHGSTTPRHESTPAREGGPKYLPLPNPTAGSLRVFSWNVNGIAPFVSRYLQPSIRSFLKPSTASDRTKRKRTRSPGSDSDAKGNGQGEGAGDSETEDQEPCLRRVLRRFAWPHVLFLQEVKIKNGDERTQSAVRTAVNDDGADTTGSRDAGPAYVVHFTLPRDPHNARGFGGRLYGVAAVVRRDLPIERIREVDWDLEGRVQVLELAATATPKRMKVAPVNVYAVNSTANPYRDPATGLPAGTRHGRKRAVHSALRDEALRLQERGFAVVIAGDLNVARDARDGFPNLRTWPHEHVVNRADFEGKFFRGPGEGHDEGNGDEQSFDGIDAFRLLHGAERRYSYHPRGRPWGSSCDRVDLVIVSRRLGRQVRAAGICDNPRDRGPSDHCPVWVEIGPEGEEDVAGDGGASGR
ncbi:Endonuclease/exonuclease/phosphatase [Xylariomycetidae sp. FL0641]|nr:Endonuclease/exonuclease/phosphatase [Xylariomycetidae sp. FL0641]